MDPLKKLTLGAGYTFLGYCISKSLNYLYRVLIARISPELYGELSIALSIFGVLGLFSLVGLNTGVTRYVSYYLAKEDYEKVKQVIHSAFTYSLTIAILLAILLYGTADVISKFYQLDLLKTLLKIFAIAIPFYAMRDIFLAVLRGYQYVEYEMLLRMLTENVIKIVLTYILILFGLNVVGATIAHTLAIIVTAIIVVMIAYKNVYFLIKDVKYQPNYDVKKELLRYSLPVMLSTIIAQIFVYSDLLMLGVYRTIDDVGIYNTALPTASITSILPGSIISLFLPVMTELYAKNNKTEFEKTYRSCAKWIFFSIMPIALFIMFFSRELLTLVFGQVYGKGGISLSILVVCNIVYYIFAPSLEILNVQKKTHIIMANTVFASSSNILLNYLLIPKYGMVGGAIATTFSMTSLGILECIEGVYYAKIQPIQKSFWKAIFSCVICILVVTLIFTYLPEKLLWSMPIAFLLYACLYGCMIIFLKAYDETDKEIFNAIKRKIMRLMPLISND